MSSVPKESWTFDALWAKLRELKSSARNQVERHSINNGRLIALDKRTALIRDERLRAIAKSEVRKLVGNQSAIASSIRNLNAMWRALMEKVKQVASKIRVPVPSGLGNPVVIVPVVVAGAVLTAIAFVYKVKLDNDRQEKLIAERASIIEGMIAGQIPAPTAERMLNEVNRTSPIPSGDVFGISSILGSAAPIAIAVAVIAIVPMLARK